LLRDYFTGNKDISLALTELEEQIKKIESDIAAFQVAEDYHDIQHEADEIKSLLFSLNNEIVIIQNNIKNVENSLPVDTVSSMSVSDLEKVYKESKIFFSETVKKTLQDVELFYETLITNRMRRLSEQKTQLIIALTEKSSQQIELQKKFDEKMKYLGDHQALDVFLALSQKSANLKSQKDDLDKYQGLQAEYRSKGRKAKKELIELSEITDNYLSEIEENTKTIKEYFRSLAKLFYPNSTAGLTVETNEGENQLAFHIEPRIESDASDGINNVKIFCYDLSILLEGKNHSIDFVFHDSRLYDGIDERQKIVLFKTLHDTFANTQKQYIATINQNQLNEIKANMTPEEYNAIIDTRTVLTLTDDNDSEKLLGIRVDIGNK
jgi:uncharacterized protein YydD (DUF2326 family)